MTGRIYKPGKIDDDAYGPAPVEAPLPKWNPESEAERRHFIWWCCEMLERDRLDSGEAIGVSDADSPEVYWLRDLLDKPTFEALRIDLPFMTWEEFKRQRYGDDADPSDHPIKPGTKADPEIAAAIIENTKLTTLFKRHFGKVRRASRPSRSEILQIRHGLSEGQVITLEGYLFKAK